MYQVTFLWYSAKKIPYMAFIWWSFIADNLISLCSNKTNGNSFHRRRGGHKSKQEMITKKQQGFCTWKRSICSFFPKQWVWGNSETAGVESLVGLYGESPLEHYSTSFWTSLSVSFQTIRVCSFQNNKRKKNYKITKPLNLLKIFGVSKVTLFEGINSV